MREQRLKPPLHGLLAEFETPEQLLHAARRAYEAGYRRMDAYTPFPVHGLSETLGHGRTWMPQIVLIAGLTGAAAGFGLQYFMTVLAYAHNVGGRPLFSWPAYIPITFEMTILLAALSGVIGMLALNGLPQPYHPVFNEPEFLRASHDRFFLAIEASDEEFDLDRTRDFLRELDPLEVFEVDE
ncbi:MAG: DUF3341 domain-containing protein [Bryobacteraceae bacterium]